MPRGEETQEGRETPQEGQEANLEVERTQEVVEQPQDVVERERPKEESEAIEREIVQAVDAVEDRGPKPEDQKIDAMLDKTSFKVESPAPEWEEEPLRPPQGTMEDGGQEKGEDRGPKTEDREQVQTGEQISATPINTPGGSDEISATPINTPGRVDQVDLSPDDVKLDESSLDTGDREKTPTQPVIEKELPEGGQMEEGLDQREDIQGMMDKDLDSLMPDGGEILGADGKKFGGSKYGDDVSGIPEMDSGGKIDGSSEDPSGDQFAGKGMFKPGKGPGGGGMESDTPGTKTERDVVRFIKTGASEKEIGVTEEILQEQAMDDYEITQAILSTDEEEEEKLRKKYGGSTSETSAKESTPDGEEGGSDVHAVSQAEFDAVIDKVDGGQISTKDPDGQGEGVPDRLTAEGAKRVKDAMDNAASTKHKQKKAGSEVVTDPDSEDPEQGELGKKQGL